LEEAERKLEHARPNERDCDPVQSSAAYLIALRQHQDRVQTVRAVATDLKAITRDVLRQAKQPTVGILSAEFDRAAVEALVPVLRITVPDRHKRHNDGSEGHGAANRRLRDSRRLQDSGIGWP
jgi:hypothetical protein